MKRKINKLRGKRLVTGDPNLMTKDEIYINATPNGVEVKEIGTDGGIKDIASGGGGGEGGSSVEYLDVRSLDDVTKFILVSGALAFNGSMTMGDKVVKMVSPFGSFGIVGTTIDFSELKFIAIDFEFKTVTTDRIQSIKDILIEQYNYTEEKLAAIPRITEEEFYNLEA